MLKEFKTDLNRYTNYEPDRSWLFCLLTKQGLWALAEYRFSHWVLTQVHIPGIRQFLRLLGFIWHKLVEILAGIDLPSKTTVGEGLYIAHFGGIFIHQNVIIGDNCNLSQGITMGYGGRGNKKGVPKLGDRVYVGAGAKLIGSITIGDDVAIGANAVVTKDLPDKAVAAGVPAKILNYNGSQEIINSGLEESTNDADVELV